MVVDAAKAPRVVNGIPRFADVDNYSESFGFQWNRFASTQLHPHSSERLWRETGWTAAELAGLDILEVGSGAGRFSRVILEETKANLYSVDYSTAVDANLRNNGAVAPDRFHLYQASIYEMPFADGSFDKVLCLGVLQHTPNFEASVRALVAKAKPGGEIVVDFYPIRGWWTKIHAKYLFRPIAKRLPNDRLLRLIERNAGWLIATHQALAWARLHALTRFLPLVDIDGTLPKNLSREELREWAILDTFDMFSPEFDNPQRTTDVVAMFESAGAGITHVETGLVRAIKS
jgi:SAM-dependent methyltransferase